MIAFLVAFFGIGTIAFLLIMARPLPKPHLEPKMTTTKKKAPLWDVAASVAFVFIGVGILFFIIALCLGQWLTAFVCIGVTAGSTITWLLCVNEWWDKEYRPPVKLTQDPWDQIMVTHRQAVMALPEAIRPEFCLHDGKSTFALGSAWQCEDCKKIQWLPTPPKPKPQNPGLGKPYSRVRASDIKPVDWYRYGKYEISYADSPDRCPDCIDPYCSGCLGRYS